MAWLLPTYFARRGGRVWISPDDTVLLLPDRSGNTLAKYLLSEMRGDAFGRPRGSFPVGAWVGDVAFSRDSATAYVVDIDGSARVLDVATMTATLPPIPCAPLNKENVTRLRNSNAALSPDGAYLVVTAGIGALSVVDLAARRTSQVDTPGIEHTWDLSFHHMVSAPTYLAVGGRSVVGVYDLSGTDPLSPVAAIPIPALVWPSEPRMSGQYRYGAIACTGSGDGIVAAISGRQELRILDVHPGTDAALERRLDFDSCAAGLEGAESMGVDVVTLNDRLATPTPTSSPTATPTATPLATRTETPEPTPTPTPQPLYLPIGVMDRCTQSNKHVDVALVIDTSGSMGDRTREGGPTKLEAARDAAGQFLVLLNYQNDQVAHIQFNAAALVIVPLTSDRAALVAGLDTLRQEAGTRIDLALDLGRSELLGERHKSGNNQVRMLLTDGRPTNTTTAEVLAAGNRLRQAGINAYAIGLGDDVDGDLLGQLATRPESYYAAPDRSDLEGMYQRIAYATPAPGCGRRGIVTRGARPQPRGRLNRTVLWQTEPRRRRYWPTRSGWARTWTRPRSRPWRRRRRTTTTRPEPRIWGASTLRSRCLSRAQRTTSGARARAC